MFRIAFERPCVARQLPHHPDAVGNTEVGDILMAAGILQP
jgi:hypothetical protein